MFTYIAAGVTIPVEGIENGAIFNDDGHGWVVASASHGLVVGKSMDYKESIALFLEERARQGKNSTAMFHSRWGTHGVMGEFNIHPFYADDLGQTIMMHNGVLGAKYHPTKSDPRSDTRIFVDRVTPTYINNENGVPSRRGGKALSKLIGSGNKLGFLSVASGQPKVRIINADLGIQDEGVWYSNSGFMPYVAPKAKSYGSWAGWGGWDKTSSELAEESIFSDDKYMEGYFSEDCEFCGAMDSIDEAGNFCFICDTCMDCKTHLSDCMCYTPESAWGPSPMAAIEA